MDAEIDDKTTRHERSKRKSNKEAEVSKKAKVTRTSNRTSKKNSQVGDTNNTKPTRMNVDIGKTTRNEKNDDVKKKYYHYELDLAEMAERKTINVSNLKNYFRDRFKNEGKIENLANTVTVEEEQWKIVVKSEIFFKKSVLKYHSKKYLKMKKLRNYVQVVGNGNLNYRFVYYKDQEQ